MTSDKPEPPKKPAARRRGFSLIFRLALLAAIYLLSPGPVFYFRHMTRLAETPIGPAGSESDLDTTVSKPSDETDKLIRAVYAPIIVLRQQIPAVERFYDWYLHLFVPRSPYSTPAGEI